MTDQFYATPADPVTDPQVRRGSGAELICICEPGIEGAAEQIARALNRLPQAEALLIRVAQMLGNYQDSEEQEEALNRLADEIEDWMVNG